MSALAACGFRGLAVLAGLYFASAVSLSELLEPRVRRFHSGVNWAEKRTGKCEPWKPFQCPEGTCIPIKYLCDGSDDCADYYDEDIKMCTAAKRPPVEETEAFLKALMQAHGGDFFVTIFGDKAQDEFKGFGGIEQFAVALSESPTALDFGAAMGLTDAETTHMKDVLMAIADGDTDGLGFKGSEASDLRFYIDKLIETGFFA